MAASLTKLDLNNQIVTMRHNVSRAKVQTLNKLVHQIRMLRNKKGPDHLKVKNEAKANRLLKEVMVIKKIPPDEVAAFSLSNSKVVSDILKDVESSPRLIGLAKLSIHKSIAPIVQQFHSKYTDWVTSVPKVLIALKNGTKLKLDDEKGKSQKRQKKSDLPSYDGENDSPSTPLDSDEEMGSNDDSESVSGSEISNENSNGGVEEDSIVSTRGNSFSVTSDNGSESFNEFQDGSETDEIIEDDKSLTSEKMNDSINKVNLTKSKTQKELKEKVDSNSLKSNTGKRKNLSSPKFEVGKKNIDPFFMGANNEHYETCNPVIETDQGVQSFDHRNNSESFNSKRGFSNFKSRDNTKNFKGGKPFINKHNQKRNFTSDNKQFNMDIPNKKMKRSNIVPDKFNNNNKNKKEDKTELRHPSWEAKKKISSIVPFTGKKIVF